MRFSSDDKPTANSQANWPWLPPGQTTSGAVRTVISALSAFQLSQIEYHVGVGLALPGVPQGECGTMGRQAVPLRPRALTRDAPTLAGSAAMYTEGTASRPPPAKGLADIGVQENERITGANGARIDRMILSMTAWGFTQPVV
jgi:hypothetical protein